MVASRPNILSNVQYYHDFTIHDMLPLRMFFTNLILALSLAADAFVVSLALGIDRKQLPRLGIYLIPLNFGIFQAVMPWLGWKTGALFYNTIAGVDHWIAFILLTLIGINMVRSANKPDEKKAGFKISVKSILLLGIATSIDALAIGFTLPTISSQPIITILTIGGITTLVCYLAFVGTRWIPTKITAQAELGAGLILIGLGCKILISQLLLS